MSLVGLSCPTISVAFSQFGGCCRQPNRIRSSYTWFDAVPLRKVPPTFATIRQGRVNFFTSLSSSTSTFDESFSWDEPEHVDDEFDNEFDNELDIDNDEGTDDGEDESSELLQEYEAWTKALDQAIQTLEKKRNSLQLELEKAQGAEKTAARAQLLVSHLYLFTPGVKSATVQDWEHDGRELELTLDPQYNSASEEADALFEKVRKLKRGSQVVSDLLNDTSKSWQLLQEARKDLSSAVSKNDSTILVDEGRFGLVQDRLQRYSGQTGFQIPDLNNDVSMRPRSSPSIRQAPSRRKQGIGSPASNIRKLTSPSGCTVLVGRNKRGNEYLSLTVARGNDVWMHSRGCPGAHVLIQNRRGGPIPTEEDLQFAADLAIFYSDLRNEKKAPVTAAEPKHLLKPRNAPSGAIKVREEWRTFMGRPQCVPDDLKEAREESGHSDEYRSVDKAKHRQRTKKAAEQEKAKKRKAARDRKQETRRD